MYISIYQTSEMQCYADGLHYVTYPIHVKDIDQWAVSE